MFKSIVNAVINSNSITAKVIGYTALVAVGIGADIISAGAKKTETKETKVAEAPAPATEEVHDEDILEEVIHDEDILEEVIHDEDILEEVIHDEDILEEVIHDEDIVVEIVHENPAEYDDSADKEAENELFEAAIKSISNSFVLACEKATEAREFGDEGAVVAMEGMAKACLNYLQLNLGKEDEYLVVHNAREALAAFRTFGPKRIEWM